MTKRLYPLLCGFSENVMCSGFVAHVTASGRALAVQEDGEWSLYGVRPGDLSSGGATLREAHYALLDEFRKVLFDIAASARSFEAFKSEVEDFFNGGDEETDREWREAVDAVRSGKVSLDELPRASADEAPRIAW